MISFSTLDIFILISFFVVIFIVGLIPKNRDQKDADGFLLSGRKVGLFLFILTNVATWYGGILGVGEFTYRYGLLSWFTQGLPYYIFAFLFALLFAEKIRSASLFTIPDKLEETYNKKVGVISSVIIFLLVSPAPYLLMIGLLIQMVFDLDLLTSLFIGISFSTFYLFRGGYKANIYTDAVQFFIMFIGFFIIVFVAINSWGDIAFLEDQLPSKFLTFTGEASPTFIVVWFLIALWTFADPGFHQRCYSAKTTQVAKYGIIISIFFWALFDLLTTTTGLYAKALLPELSNPVLAFPMLAEKILGSGLKGIFYAALLATILSTLNSFLFLSATTFGRDFISKYRNDSGIENLTSYTRIGLIASAIISIVLAYSFTSVIEIWYVLGSVLIPGLLMLIFSAYFPKLKISSRHAFIESIAAITTSLAWMIIRSFVSQYTVISEIEPMIIGTIVAVVIHTFSLRSLKLKTKDNLNSV
ncbi:MAG: sodium:solute symporter family protein [Bacteroidota bacterium]